MIYKINKLLIIYQELPPNRTAHMYTRLSIIKKSRSHGGRGGGEWWIVGFALNNILD